MIEFDETLDDKYDDTIDTLWKVRDEAQADLDDALRECGGFGSNSGFPFLVAFGLCAWTALWFALGWVVRGLT